MRILLMHAACVHRMKREEDRIQREMQEREEEEARNLLAEARRRGSKVAKIKEGEKLDKRTVQVSPPLFFHLFHYSQPRRRA